MRYPQAAARRAPFVGTGTHMTGDTFFHGPGMSNQAQYIAKLYGADDYVITEMEAAAITLVIKRTHGTDRVMSLRGAVNFDQGNPRETTLQHLDPAPGETAGGFAETVENIELVGSRVVDHIVAELAAMAGRRSRALKRARKARRSAPREPAVVRRTPTATAPWPARPPAQPRHPPWRARPRARPAAAAAGRAALA